jgi:hypothetical protein
MTTTLNLVLYPAKDYDWGNWVELVPKRTGHKRSIAGTVSNLNVGVTVQIATGDAGSEKMILERSVPNLGYSAAMNTDQRVVARVKGGSARLEVKLG